MQNGMLSSHLRPERPTFLDLPWHRHFDDWSDHTDRVVQLPRGESRHPVVFVQDDGKLFACKAMEPHHATREYHLLLEMENLGLPAVTAAGHLLARTDRGEFGVLITHYLENSLPYHSLFLQNRLVRYRQHLLDAMAGLLVQLHVVGVFWGDCSLYNTLFRRDAGTLQAYLVDAETSVLRPQLEDTMRRQDLDTMEENVAGVLSDLMAMGALGQEVHPFEVAADIKRRYDALWNEIRREEVIGPHERYRIEERIRRLNELGFSVGEIELRPSDRGEQLRLAVSVTDRGFHRRKLHTLTGLEVQAHQGKQLMNEIQQLRATLSEQRKQSVSLSQAAYHWLETVFEPSVGRLRRNRIDIDDPVELYCQLLEHKWFMSERQRHDVGYDAALDDFVARYAELQERGAGVPNGPPTDDPHHSTNTTTTSSTTSPSS